MSITTSPRVASIWGHTCRRACAAAARSAPRRSASTPRATRYSVDADGTEPNRASSERRTSMSLHASPPPANTNNACTSALPRSWTGSRSPIGP